MFAATSRAGDSEANSGASESGGHEHRGGRLIGLLSAEREPQRGRGDAEGGGHDHHVAPAEQDQNARDPDRLRCSSGSSSRGSESTHAGATSGVFSKLGMGSRVAR